MTESREAEGAAPTRPCKTCGGERSRWDGSQWRCPPCRRASNLSAALRYKATAAGMLSAVRHEATRRGSR